MAYEVPDLPYDYGALDPHIDEQTMRIHHDKHHQAYVDKARTSMRFPTTSAPPSATTPAATPTTASSG